MWSVGALRFVPRFDDERSDTPADILPYCPVCVRRLAMVLPSRGHHLLGIGPVLAEGRHIRAVGPQQESAGDRAETLDKLSSNLRELRQRRNAAEREQAAPKDRSRRA